MAHECEAVVVSCIDFRLQDDIYRWTTGRLGQKNHDRVALAGGVKDLAAAVEQVGLSYKLHRIKTVILINHEDCGAYGQAGTPEKHATDLKDAAAKIEGQIPSLKPETYYLHLDGTFEQV